MKCLKKFLETMFTKRVPKTSGEQLNRSWWNFYKYRGDTFYKILDRISVFRLLFLKKIYRKLPKFSCSVKIQFPPFSTKPLFFLFFNSYDPVRRCVVITDTFFPRSQEKCHVRGILNIFINISLLYGHVEDKNAK